MGDKNLAEKGVEKFLMGLLDMLVLMDIQEEKENYPESKTRNKMQYEKQESKCRI